MVNEIVLGILDPLLLDTTSQVETVHPLCSCAPERTRQPSVGAIGSTQLRLAVFRDAAC